MPVLDYYGREQLQKHCKVLSGLTAVFTHTACRKNKNIKDLDKKNADTSFEQTFILLACEEGHHRCSDVTVLKITSKIK